MTMSKTTPSASPVRSSTRASAATPPTPAGPGPVSVDAVRVGTITTPNPYLWVDPMTLGTSTVQYCIQTSAPAPSWFNVNQFCSLLSTYWLNDPNKPLSYGITALTDSVKIAMAHQLIALPNLQAQVTEAAHSIANSSIVNTVATLSAALANYQVGTKIWAGNSYHVLAFVITAVANPQTGAVGTYTAYDSNTGSATTGRPTTGLPAQLSALGYNVFVVGAP